MQSNVRLGPTDPTIFTKCEKCSRTGHAVRAGTFYGKAFSVREWKRGQVCENCDGPLVILYEVRQDD